jgi:hypothetical protein
MKLSEEALSLKTPTFAITIVTFKRFRKMQTEEFIGHWGSVEEIRRVLARYRPEAQLVSVYRIAEQVTLNANQRTSNNDE